MVRFSEISPNRYVLPICPGQQSTCSMPTIEMCSTWIQTSQILYQVGPHILALSWRVGTWWGNPADFVKWYKHTDLQKCIISAYIYIYTFMQLPLYFYMCAYIQSTVYIWGYVHTIFKYDIGISLGPPKYYPVRRGSLILLPVTTKHLVGDNDG